MKDSLQYSAIYAGNSKRYIVKVITEDSNISKFLSESQSNYFDILNDLEKLEWIKEGNLEVPEIVLESNGIHKYEVTYKTSPISSKTIVTSANDETEIYQRYKNREIVSIKEIGKKLKREIPVIESLDNKIQGFKKFIKTFKNN